MNKQETSAAANRTGGDTSDCHPGDAHKVSNVPATAEVSKGIASLPSPDKTRPEKQQLGYSLLEETPPWERQSFVDNTFNVSFQEDVGTPVATGRLTPGLRRLCLDGSPMMAWARPDRHSPFQQATSPSLVNESPPASFIDCSIAPITPTGPANTVDLPSGAGTVITVLLPDVVPLTPQNDTMDVGCGSGSPALSFVLPCPQNTVDSPCRDSATAAVANIDRLAADINGTMDLPNGTSSAGAVSDITMNGAVDLADCVGSTGATPTGQENITVEIRSDCSKTMSAVASSISTPAPEINITMEIRSDCSMTMSEVASSISTPAPEINTTVDKENDGKSTTTEVKSIVPVHHNTTVDFPNGNGSGTSDVSMTARHNGTVDLATPVSTKPAREMNSTVELVRRGNNPLTMASAKAMNITVEVLSTTTSASPSVPTVAPTTTTANDVTLAESLSASPEMMVKRPPLEVNVFMLDESLDLHSAGLVTSTPMPEHREFSFSRPAKVIGKACEARKQLVLPSNTTTPPTKTDGDPPGGDLPAAAPALPCEEGREEATAGLKQRRPQAKGILFPRVVGMSAVSGHGIKLPGLPVTRRAIPKPTCTLANSMLEGNAAPSGIPGAYKRFSLGMKAALRSAASATPTQQPAPAAEKRLSLAPACSARLRKKTNEGAIPSLSKDTAASSVRPSQASASLKRPVPEPKGGPAKRSKGEPVSNIRSGLLRKRALPTVPEDTISTSSAHTVSGASSVTAPSLDSEDTYLCECGRKTACKKCQHLLQENQKLRRELSTLKSHK